MNLKELSLFITEPLVVDVKELSQHRLASRIVEKHGKADETSPGDEMVGEPAEEYSEAKQLSLTYEGEYKKGILVIHRGRELSEETTDFLLKVLQAVGCSLRDIALVSEAALEGTSMESIESISPNKILVFGKITHPLMQWRKENYETHSLEEGAEYFYADELEEFANNIPLKKKLWTSLQVLFNIK
jgi:hypothetical protein